MRLKPVLIHTCRDRAPILVDPRHVRSMSLPWHADPVWAIDVATLPLEHELRSHIADVTLSVAGGEFLVVAADLLGDRNTPEPLEITVAELLQRTLRSRQEIAYRTTLERERAELAATVAKRNEQRLATLASWQREQQAQARRAGAAARLAGAQTRHETEQGRLRTLVAEYDQTGVSLATVTRDLEEIRSVIPKQIGLQKVAGRVADLMALMRSRDGYARQLEQLKQRISEQERVVEGTANDLVTIRREVTADSEAAVA